MNELQYIRLKDSLKKERGEEGGDRSQKKKKQSKRKRHKDKFGYESFWAGK